MKNTSSIFAKKQYVILFALLCTILWGSAYPGVKIGYTLFYITGTEVGPKLLFAGYRFIAGGMLILLYSIIVNRRLHLPGKQEWKGIVALALSQTFLQYIFYYIGLSNTSGSKGAIVYGTGTFMSVILAHFIFKNDRMNKAKALGCIIGFAGVVIVNLSKNQTFTISMTGEGFLLIGAFGFAVSTIIGKLLAGKQDPILLTGYQMLLGGVLLTITGYAVGGTIQKPDGAAVAVFCYLAMVSAIASTLWTILLKYNKVAKISIYSSLMPVFGAVLSGVFLQESIFNWRLLVALLCVSSGIYIVNCEKKVNKV